MRVRGKFVVEAAHFIAPLFIQPLLKAVRLVDEPPQRTHCDRCGSGGNRDGGMFFHKVSAFQNCL